MEEESTTRASAHPVDGLFEDAESEGGLDYIYTLVRVDGIQCGRRDPLLVLHERLQLPDIVDDLELEETCRSLLSEGAVFSLIANLLNSATKSPYDLRPFRHLNRGVFPHVILPTPAEQVRDLKSRLLNANRGDLAYLLAYAYPEQVLGWCCGEQEKPPNEEVRRAISACRKFLEKLLGSYYAERRKFIGVQRFYKQPGFEVLELLVNDDVGLYGFKMHFSTAGDAWFARHTDSTECTNVVLGTPLNFMIGDLDERKTEWRVGAKRLYEIGLPGRYNELGEWKPIIHPGNADHIMKEAVALAGSDDDVGGAFFYMVCTGHRVIEFVVRANLELPSQYVRFDDRFHLWMCPLPEGTPSSNLVWRIYDGWLDVEAVTPETLRSAMTMISVGINRMAFAYGVRVHWRPKYRLVLSDPGIATPKQEDLAILDSLLRDFPSREDAFLLDQAIDWYNRGNSSHNVFVAFLCYYIALESIAVAVDDGHADFGLAYAPATKQERRERTVACIQEKFKQLYGADPVKFVREAYVDCVYSLKEKTKRVTGLVFGSKHPNVKALFEKQEGFSLSDIRNKLVHGSITLLDRGDEKLVRSRLGEMARIAREFLIRIVFLKEPGERVPSWSGQHKLPMSFADPRCAMYLTDERLLPTKDWRIRPEWCE